MDNQQNYKQLYLEKVEESTILKNEIEKYKRKLELTKSLKRNSFDFFDRCYNPIRNEYSFVYQRLNYFFEKIQELKNVYNQRLLLSPNFSNIKIKDEEKTKIINETRTILSKIQIDKIPPLKDFYINKSEGDFLSAYEHTHLKKFVVKNKKIL